MKKFIQRQFCFFIFTLLLALSFSFSVFAVEINELEAAISDRLTRVREYRFIREEAEKLGVRAWLFGGTAAGYGHYVDWDLKREAGDTRFQPDRFDYDYTNIYRSTQDLDIVVDGPPEKIQALQKALASKYPHLQGSKSSWDVRPLRTAMEQNEALLNNPDYLNQHSDSNSTGMIEITKPPEGEAVVRDLRDWNTKEPVFLKDLHSNKLHYYFSPTHSQTSRASKGLNPPILSAIRFLTKAFQYELEIRPEDLEAIKKIVNDFDPKKDIKNDYIANWIEKNGKKLIQHAVNIEYAWDTLEKLGLRKKLADVKNNVSEVESLSWWMNKEPLRTKAIGLGNGKTAKELGLDIVAHDTNNFLAYESITRAHTGDPNVLISRRGMPNEYAIFGDGFYTRIGREGAHGNGLPIRFHLDPNAREGTDFKIFEDYILLVHNKNAIRVIPESLNIGPVEYFTIIANEQSFFSDNKASMEKINRRIGAKLSSLTPEEEVKINEIFKLNMDKPLVVEHWLKTSMAVKAEPETISNLILRYGETPTNAALAKYVLSLPEPNPEWLIRLAEKDPKVALESLAFIISNPRLKSISDDQLIKLFELLFYLKHSYTMTEQQRSIIGSRLTPEFIEKLRPTLRKGLRENYFSRGLSAGTIIWLSSPISAKYPEILKNIRHNISSYNDLAAISSYPHWSLDRTMLKMLIDKSSYVNRILLSEKFHTAEYTQFADLLLEIIHTDTVNRDAQEKVLNYPHWQNFEPFRKACKGDPTLDCLRGISSSKLLPKGATFVEKVKADCRTMFLKMGRE